MEKRKFKTTKRLAGGGARVYRKWGEWDVGDVFVGKYISSYLDQYDKPGWVFTVEEAFFKDKKLAKELVGKNLALNGAGMLNKAMAEIEEGQLVQITYTGTSTIEKGKFAGKDAHTMEVDLVSEDNGEEYHTDSEDDEYGDDL